MRSLVTQTVQRLEGYFDTLREHYAQIDLRSTSSWAVRSRRVGPMARQALGPRRHAGPTPVARAEPWLRDESLRVAGPLRAAQQRLPVAHRRGPAHGAGPLDDVAARLDAQEAVPALKPCLTTWMSATVGASFLSTTDRKREGLGEPSAEQAAFESKLKASLDTDKGLSWWREAKRPVEWWTGGASIPSGGRRSRRRGRRPRAQSPRRHRQGRREEAPDGHALTHHLQHCGHGARGVPRAVSGGSQGSADLAIPA